MNEGNSLLFILKNLNSFQNDLKRQIDTLILQPIECYLMDKNWKNHLLNYFIDTKSYNSSIRYFRLSFCPDIQHSFIDNFSDAINFIHNGGQFTYVRKDTMELFFDKGELMKFHKTTKIYCLNKKIIINFQGNDINKSLLILNPFEVFDNKNIFIILGNNNYAFQKKLFENLLSENNNNFVNLKNKYNNSIIEFEDYLKTLNIVEIEKNSFSYNIINNNSTDIKKILEILILIYYHEKYLSKGNNTFSEYQKYYLINPEWIEIYKEFYYYNDLVNLLKNYDFEIKKNEINYLKIDNYVNFLVSRFYKNYKHFNIIGIPDHLKNTNSLKVSLYMINTLKYFNNCYILPLKIVNKIVELEFKKKLLLEPYKIISKNENVFLHIDEKNINIGFLNDNLLFQTKYIISYNSLIKCEYEKRELFNLPIKTYLYKNNCLEIISEIQTMKNKDNIEIGKVLILNDNNFNLSKRLKFLTKCLSEKKLFNKNIGTKYDKKTYNASYLYLQNPIKNTPNNNRNKYNSNRNINTYSNLIYSKNDNVSISNYTKTSNNEQMDFEEEFKTLRNRIINNPNNIRNEEKLKLSLMMNEDEKKESEFLSKISNLEQELKDNKEKFLQKENELKNGISLLEKDIEKSNIENKELKDKINVIEKTNNEKEKDLNKKISLLEQSDLENKKIIEEKNKNEKEYLSQIEELKKKNEEMQKNINEIKRLKETIASLEKYEKEYENIKEKNEMLERLNESIENEYKIKENNIIKKENEINLKLEEINKKEEECNNKISIIEEHKKNMENEKNQLNLIKEKYNQYLEKNSSLIEENKNIEIQIKNKQSTLNDLNLQINNNKYNEKEEKFAQHGPSTLIKFIENRKSKNMYNNLNGNNNNSINNINESNYIYNSNSNINKNKINMDNSNNSVNSNSKMNIYRNNINNINNNDYITNSNNSINNHINNNISNNISNNNSNNINNINYNIINNISNSFKRNQRYNINYNDLPNFSYNQQNNIMNNSSQNNNFQNMKNFINDFNNINYNANKSQMFSSNGPVLVGLNNTGALPCMNSILQCLIQTKPLTEYLTNSENYQLIYSINDEIDLKLTPSYVDLIKKLWHNEEGNKSFPPYFFKNTIEKMNPLFKNNQTDDIKELIVFILEQMHKELIIINNSNTQLLEYNQYDRKNSFLFFLNNYKIRNSIISEIFWGIKQIESICLNCKNTFNSQNFNYPVKYNYETFNCLIIPLEEVKNMKNKNNINNNNNNFFLNNIDTVSIKDCLEYWETTEKYTGENQSYCNLCKQLSDSIFSTKIFYGPNVLIIILNRGKDNPYDINIDFQESISIGEYDFNKGMNNNIKYNLYGVISNIGEIGSSPHFIANCKIDKNWYRFDDSNIIQINNKNNIMESGTPYILFYEKENYVKDIFSKYNFK